MHSGVKQYALAQLLRILPLNASYSNGRRDLGDAGRGVAPQRRVLLLALLPPQRADPHQGFSRPLFGWRSAEYHHTAILYRMSLYRNNTTKVLVY